MEKKLEKLIKSTESVKKKISGIIDNISEINDQITSIKKDLEREKNTINLITEESFHPTNTKQLTGNKRKNTNNKTQNSENLTEKKDAKNSISKKIINDDYEEYEEIDSKAFNSLNEDFSNEIRNNEKSNKKLK